MKMKRLAVRGLIWLFVMVALCMFFAGTVQSITTPKVQLITAGKGRLEKESSYAAEVFFPEMEGLTIAGAGTSPITIQQVHVKNGDYVRSGDCLFTASVTGYADEMEKLRTDLTMKNAQLNTLDIQNRKLSRSSRQNELYEDMEKAQNDYSNLAYHAKLLAAHEGITLLNEADDWSKQLALVENVPQTLLDAVAEAQAAQKTMLDGEKAFYAVFEDRKLRVSDEVFNYIRDRNKLLKEMERLTQQMVALDLSAAELGTIKAERDGWIVSVNVQSGEEYDGTKPALVMSKIDSMPSIRAKVENEAVGFTQGTKVTLLLPDDSKEKTTIIGTKTTTEGRYIELQMPEALSGAGNSKIKELLGGNGLTVMITSRAKTSTSLVPASAIRTEGDEYYVYIANETQSGLLTGGGLKLKKMTLNVIDHNDRQYAVNEDLSYQQIACREDRPLSDGCLVMEYTQ